MPTPETIASIREFLIDQGFVVHFAGDGESITVHVPLKHVRLPFGFRILEDQGLLQVEAYLPVVVPEDKKLAASDFFNRINWGLKRGRFVMDPGDGEVRFRQEFAFANVSNCVDTAVLYLANGGRVVDAFFPALTGVIFRDTSPEDALEQGTKEYELLASED
jgi:hypothetical protein